MFEINFSLSSDEAMNLLRMLNERQMELREAIGAEHDEHLLPYLMNDEEHTTELLDKLEREYTHAERMNSKRYAELDDLL